MQILCLFYSKDYKEQIQSDTPDLFKLHATYIKVFFLSK